MEPVHIRRATPAGNGAHIPVPKAWIGQEVAAVPASNISILVQNNSIAKGPPGLGLEPEDVGLAYHGFFRNRSGEQLVLEIPANQKSATLWHGDLDWEPISIMHAKGDLCAILADKEIHLNEEEWAWVRACLRGARIDDLRELPEWSGLPESRIRKAFASDKKVQVEVLEGLLRQLRTNS